ncbi:FAD-dependent monooxygenase yanF [Colletotrichum gloeosporioides]|uniref:FAD binding domain-containing protein n=2 Tax=Colletotrichum gloeosporioides TaxID=474922 RepID=T0JWM9_COLGC|nr:FAD-dependent monooxygenase yanF [Colletotrichum gloeosporioides]EQB47417.1 FAD binding domain-containing protein [Colletotrichum gloeosporioides Cg-14]KAF3809051.1 FAD-dependent monooxygenase yanF [Colletotrichum gloeosporioides]
MKSLTIAAGAFCLLGTASTVAGAAAPVTRTTELADFARSLGVTDEDLQKFTEKYSPRNGSSSSVEGACLLAQYVLGEPQVDASIVDQTAVEVNWSQTCQIEPHCVIQPRDASDVSVSLRIVEFFGTKFAVRSGGHSPNPGWASIGQEGVLVDLQRLNGVTLSDDRAFASVGPGGRWGDVYSTLDADKVVVMGGRLPSVGVGGLMLGGGYFHVSEQFGLAADNVKNFEVVLANGTTIDANADLNQDLFWALKGGGPNFGVVTRYDLYTIPVYDVWGEILIYSVDQAEDVLRAFDEWQKDGASDFKSTIALTVSLDSITVGLVYSEPVARRPDAFSPFGNLTPLATALPPLNTTFAFVAQLLQSAFPTLPGRHDYRGYSSRIDTELTIDMYNFWREKAIAVREATGANQTFAIQHVGQHLIDQGVEKGGNPLNIPTGDQQWWTTIIDWEDEQDDEVVRSVSIETTKKWKELGQSRGSHLDFEYMNDASRDQNPLRSYGAANLDRLKSIAASYDPKQVFQTQQNGGFLVSRA